MDVLLTIVFYACAGLALAGALASTFLPGASPWRTAGLLALAVGTAGALASLSAGLVALVALTCLGGAALLLSGARAVAATAVAPAREPRWAGQVGAAAAAALFAVLAYSAFRGDFVRGSYPGGEFGAAALGRLLFSHDAIALEAVAFILLVGLAGAAVGARARRP